MSKSISGNFCVVRGHRIHYRMSWAKSIAKPDNDCTSNISCGGVDRSQTVSRLLYFWAADNVYHCPNHKIFGQKQGMVSLSWWSGWLASNELKERLDCKSRWFLFFFVFVFFSAASCVSTAEFFDPPQLVSSVDCCIETSIITRRSLAINSLEQ